MTNWPATLLDGAVGGAVGAVGAFWSAVWVVKRQSRSDRELMKLQLDHASTAVALQSMHSLCEAILTATEHDDDRLFMSSCLRVVLAAQQAVVAVRVLSEEDSRPLATVIDAFIDTTVKAGSDAQEIRHVRAALNLLHESSVLHLVWLSAPSDS